MTTQPTYFKKKIMSNNEIVLTNTIISYKCTTREKTWAGDESVYPLKKFYVDYDVYFQNDGSISLQLIANSFNIPITGINWNWAPSPDYTFTSLDLTTDETPYFILSGNKLSFVSNPTIPTVLGLGSWIMTFPGVDPSTDSSLWISNEGLGLFQMKFYFNETIEYVDYIDNIYLVNDPTAHIVEQPKFLPDGVRQTYTTFNMILGVTPPWTFPTPQDSIEYFSKNQGSIQNEINKILGESSKSNETDSSNTALKTIQKSQTTLKTTPVTFEQLQWNIMRMRRDKQQAQQAATGVKPSGCLSCNKK